MQRPQETIGTIQAALKSKELSAVGLTQSYLDRIAALDGELNACTATFAERSLDRAARVDAGELTGPLAGIPILIKENLCTTFGQTTCASKMLSTFSSPYNATVIDRLEAAGAILLAKANMDEFAMGSSTEHSFFGPTRNPWDLSCVPGGSSGGSAAGMAAGFCAASIGSDTGGSIRQPAAYCGVVGLKPTYGRVSRFGLVAFASSLDQIGPMTHCVTDAALLLNVLAGPDERDSTSAHDQTVDDFSASIDEPIEGVRLGVPSQYFSKSNTPAVQAAIDTAIDHYRSLGAQIVDIDLPHTDYGVPTYYIVAPAEAASNLARYDGVHYGHRSTEATSLVDLYAASRSEGFGPEVQRRIMLGNYVLSSGYYDAYYLRALKVRRLIKNDFEQAFTQCDAIICPTTPSVAFGLGEKATDPLEMYLNDIYTVNANLAGIPGLTLPCGFDESGDSPLPIGLQLLGPWFDEAKLLRIARMFESTTQWHQVRPPLGLS